MSQDQQPITTPPPPNLPPFEKRAETLLDRAFGGLHHVHKLVRETPTCWHCLHHGAFATFDFNQLTLLVFAAHDCAIRVSIVSAGPRCLRVYLHERGRRDGATYERHPSLEEALECWRK